MDEKLLIAVTDATVGSAMLTVDRLFDSLDVVCANCQQKFGEHNGLNCPNGKTTFKQEVTINVET